MRLPTQRITITPSEYMLLQPGLDLLKDRFAEIQTGNFPHRHPAFRVENEATAIYKLRAFDESMALRLTNVQRKLDGMKTSRKVRLDEFEFSALAFALRLLTAASCLSVKETDASSRGALARKLERFRKRAKSAAVQLVGAEIRTALSLKWQGFVAWMRYFILQSGKLRWGPSSVSMLEQDQRVKMTAILEGVVSSAFYKPVGTAHMKRIVSLALRTIRRGRRETTLRGLLADPSRYTLMLLKFVSDRANLEKGPDFPKEPWELMMERAEIFRACQEAKRNGASKLGLASLVLVSLQIPSAVASIDAMVGLTVPIIERAEKVSTYQQAKRHDASTPRVPAPTVADLEIPASVASVTSLVSSTTPSAPPVPHSPAWDETLWDFLAEWFLSDVPHMFWRKVADRISYLEKYENFSRFHNVSYPTTNFKKLFPECRPFNDADPIECLTTQVLRFLLALGRHQDRLTSDMRIVAARAEAGRGVHV